MMQIAQRLPLVGGRVALAERSVRDPGEQQRWPLGTVVLVDKCFGSAGQVARVVQYIRFLAGHGRWMNADIVFAEKYFVVFVSNIDFFITPLFA